MDIDGIQNGAFRTFVLIFGAAAVGFVFLGGSGLGWLLLAVLAYVAWAVVMSAYETVRDARRPRR